MEVEVDRHFGFDVYGGVFVMYQRGNSLVLESGIQALVWYSRGYILGLLLFKVSRVLTMYSVTFLSGVVAIKKLRIIKLAVIPVFFISL